MNKSSLLELAKKIYFDDFQTEEDSNNAMQLFLDNVLNPNALELFYSTELELTPEEIVEKALSYKPLITPTPPIKKDN